MTDDQHDSSNASHDSAENQSESTVTNSADATGQTKRGGGLSKHFWTIVFVGCIVLFVLNESRSVKRDKTQAVDPQDVLAAGSAAGFNLLLISMDTTRQDFLTCYGYPRLITPTIDSLVEHGVRFDDPVTSAPMTLPSHAVMMTGKYPPSIGVRDNGGYRLLDKHTTLAEQLKQAGYDTGAFVSAFVLDKRFGLDQGFDYYDFDIDERGRTSVDSLLNEREGGATTLAALEWLADRKGDRPFFAWVHYFDPHQPYISPLTDTEGFEDRPYDAEIAYVDRNIKRLLEDLEKRGLRDKTLIAFVTDHGEGLMEHEEALHGIFLYESTVRSAMILSNPALFERGYRVDDRVVGMVDLAPTLLELMGVTPISGVDGISLVSAAKSPSRAIYMETLMPLANACAPLHALRTHDAKFILAPKKEYYDLTQNHKESENLFGQSDRATELESALQSMLAKWDASGEALAGAQEMSDDVARRLAAIGYAGGVPTGDMADLRDPKDQIHVINMMSEVKSLQAQGHDQQALELAREVAVQAEGWYAPIANIVTIHQTMGKHAEAAQILEDYIKNHRDAAPAQAYLHLAQAYFMLNRDTKCIENLALAEQREPDMGMIAMVRGDVFNRQGKLDKAIEQYERAFELDPLRVGPMYRDKVADARRRLRESGGSDSE